MDEVSYAKTDVFEEFKNPLLFFKSIEYQNLEKFLPKLTADIVNVINHTTRWMPLTVDYFKLYINDTLFEEYYRKFKRREFKFSSFNFNYNFIKERLVLLNNKNYKKNKSYTLKVNKEVLFTKTKSINFETFLSFLVNILNVFYFFLAVPAFNVLDSLLYILFNFRIKFRNLFI